MPESLSINGWLVPPRKLKTFQIPGAKRRVTLDADAGRVLTALAADYHKTVRPIDRGTWDEGGYNNRDARFSKGLKSNHASGTAIDLNWSEEGAVNSTWGKRFFAQAKTKIAVERLRRRYGKVLQWGGDWRTVKDYMHWEVRPGVSRVNLKAFADRLGIDAEGRRKS